MAANSGHSTYLFFSKCARGTCKTFFDDPGQSKTISSGAFSLILKGAEKNEKLKEFHCVSKDQLERQKNARYHY